MMYALEDNFNFQELRDQIRIDQKFQIQKNHEQHSRKNWKNRRSYKRQNFIN